MTVRTNLIPTDGLVHYHDMYNDNSYVSWFGNNILFDNEVKNWTISALTGTITVDEIIPNQRYLLRASTTVNTTFRFYVPLSKLTNTAIYGMSYSFKEYNGSLSMTDWCDQPLSGATTIINADHKESYAYSSRSLYDATYRFMDFSMPAGSVVEIWNIKISQGAWKDKYTYKPPVVSETIKDLTGNSTLVAGSLDLSFDRFRTYKFIASQSSNLNFSYSSTDLNGDPLFSVSMFIKRTANLSSAGFWGIGGDVILKGINSYTSVTNKISIDLWGTATFHTGVDYPLNEWIHVVWVKTGKTFSKSTVAIYINDVKYTDTQLTTVRGTTHTPDLNTSTKGITFGRLSPTNGYQAEGYIGNAMVYNRAISDAEVKQIFNAQRGRYGI